MVRQRVTSFLHLLPPGGHGSYSGRKCFPGGREAPGQAELQAQERPFLFGENLPWVGNTNLIEASRLLGTAETGEAGSYSHGEAPELWDDAGSPTEVGQGHKEEGSAPEWPIP